MIKFIFKTFENDNIITIKTTKNYCELIKKLDKIIDKDNDEIEHLKIIDENGKYILNKMYFQYAQFDDFQDIVINFKNNNIEFDDFINIIKKLNKYNQELNETYKVKLMFNSLFFLAFQND